MLEFKIGENISQEQSIINDYIKEVIKQKELIILEKCKEKLGRTLNYQEEEKYRFKRLMTEIKDNEETIYFNDGSKDGLRIVTFVQKEIMPQELDGVIRFNIEYSYY